MKVVCKSSLPSQTWLCSSTDPHHEFVIQYKQKSSDSNYVEVSRRYREFEQLYRVLCLYKPEAAVPTLPPKAVMIKTASLDSPAVVQRKNDLDNFLNEIMLNVYLCDSEPFKAFM